MYSFGTINPVTSVAAPSATSNSSLSPEDRKQQRPVTALSASEKSENDLKIIGPDIAVLKPGDAAADSKSDSTTDEPKDEFRLSKQAVDRLLETDPTLEQMVRAEVARQTPGTSSGTSSDAPVDQVAFRAKVIAYLQAMYAEDPAFQRALKLGTIVVRAVDDGSDSDIQPQVTYTTYRSSALDQGQPAQPASHNAGAGGNQDNPGQNDFIAWWPK